MELFALLQIEPAGGLSQALSSSPLLALGAMFGAGLLTSLTPCVYPMIPITAAVIAGNHTLVAKMNGGVEVLLIGEAMTSRAPTPPSARKAGGATSFAQPNLARAAREAEHAGLVRSATAAAGALAGCSTGL